MAFNGGSKAVFETLEFLRQVIVFQRGETVLMNPVIHADGVAKHIEFQRQFNCRGLRLAVALDVWKQRGVEFQRRDEERIGPLFRIAAGLTTENLPACGVLRKQIDILLRKRNLQRFDVGIACDFFQKKHGRTIIGSWLFFKTRGVAEHGQIVDDVRDEGDEEVGGHGGRREGAANHEEGENAANGGI